MFRRMLLVVLLLTVAGTSRSDSERTAVTAVRDDYGREVALLVTAVGDCRPIEGRLTGGFKFGTWRSDGTGAPRNPSLVEAAVRTQQHASGSHAKGVAALLDGDPDEAISVLEGVSDGPGAQASVYSDLAAARLARWRHSGEAFDAVRALNDARKAIALDGSLPEPYFNRALALDALGLSELGRAAWRRYRDIDSVTPWAKEAADRARRDETDDLVAPHSADREGIVHALGSQDLTELRALVDRSPEIVRQFIERDLLDRWADDYLRGFNVAARGRPSAVQLLGRLLAERSGDQLWLRVGEELDVLHSSAAGPVAAAVRELLNARGHIDANRFDAAAPLLETLARRLIDVPSLALWAEFWREYVSWHRQDRSSVVTRLSRLDRAAAAHGFRYLHARDALLRAASMESAARYDDATAAFRSAITEFEDLGERDLAASARAMHAQLLAMQGDLTSAWEQQRVALSDLREIESLRQKVVVLSNAVVLGTHYSLPYAALDVQAALIAAAQQWGDGGALVRYFVERARLSNDLHVPEEAEQALRAADDALRTIDDTSNRAIFDLDIEIERARASVNTRPAAAGRDLTNAIERLPNVVGEFRRAEVYLDIGRAARRAGASDEALRAWMTGLDIFERQRASIKTEALRISFFSRAWELYDEAVAELVRRGNFEAALSLVERSRARALRDGLLPTSSRSTDVRGLTPRLLRGTVVLTFASTKESLLVWCLDRSGIAFNQVPLSGIELKHQVDLARGALMTGKGDAGMTRLSAALIGPFREEISRASHLVVVPDGAIGSLPFSLLQLPDGGGMLIDRVALTVAPSLSVLDLMSDRLTTLMAVAPRSGAFIGDPTIDTSVFPALDRLPRARNELADSARLYPASHIYVGSEATASALSNAIGRVDVVHFAGHAVGNPEFPFRSALTVAPEPGRVGVLRPTDLAGLSAGRTRIVILSACSTASATTAFGEGALSLARPFLAAGVPDVLGTLWDVDDDAAAALVPRFHRRLRAGVAPSQALREAQLELKSSSDSRLRDYRAWSGFVVIGGIDRSVHRNEM
jgi:tetratricopeptide (TPR) repeat protein